MHFFKALGVGLALIIGTGTPALSADLLVNDTSLWFDRADRTAVRLSIDIQGVTAQQFLDALTRNLNVKWKRSTPVGTTARYVLYDGFQTSAELTSSFNGSQSLLKFEINKAYHRDIILLEKVLASLRSLGATNPNTDLPLAIKIIDLKGQDGFVSAVTGVPVRTLRQIDRAVANRSADLPLIVRYYLDDRRFVDPKEYHELAPDHGDAIVSYIPANTYGRMALVVPGESVVYHPRTFHVQSIVGRYNPGLVNSNIVQALTANKKVEAEFWAKYAPGALPITHLLSELKLDLSNITTLSSQLHDRYPRGWIIKGVNESNSNFSILTDKIDLGKELKAYQDGNFEDYRSRIYRDMAGMDEDDIYEALQEHANYLGWRISQYLQDPEHVIVQNRVRIEKEFRVEVLAGRVVRGATIDRHNWLLKFKNLPFVISPPDVIARAEAFTQSVIDRLPATLRETNFAFDIALLEDGSFIAIESNAGSESGFLINESASIRAINQALRDYPRRMRNGEISGHGLSPAEQMQFLKDNFSRWRIDPAVQFPQYRFTQEKIETSFLPVRVRPKYLVGNRCVDAYGREKKEAFR